MLEIGPYSSSRNDGTRNDPPRLRRWVTRDEFGKDPAPYDVRDDAAVLTTLLGVLTR
jgi:hypothetical protein